MSILNVNQIQPVGGGNTITVSASDVSASGATITASSFIGNVTGDLTGNVTGDLTGNVTGDLTGNVTGNVTSSSTSTFSSGLNVTGGSVGIGTDNPNAAKLDVRGSNNPLLKLTQTTSGIARLNIESETNDGYQYAGIGIGTASADAELMWTTLGFDVNVADSVRLRIPSSGDVQVLTGNLVIGTSGKGIDFSAASGSAAGSSSAVLDDYEEGTFTPRISVESQGSDAAIDNASGTYVKVGQLVYCTFNADLNGIPAGRGTSFAWQWGGLPFTSLAEGSDGSEDYIGSVRISGADHTSTYGVAAEFILRLFDNGTGGRIEVMRVSNGDIVNASLYMKDNTTINGSITYRTS